MSWAKAAEIGANVVGNIIGAGGQPEEKQSNLHLVNPGQQALWNLMASRTAGGAGDFGYGANVKSGTSQLQQMMAQRGIKVGSGGAYTGAYGNMVGNAMGQDAAARRQYAINLLQSPLQIATATGANFIPGSTSAGASSGAQEGSFNQFQSTGWTPGGMGPNSYTGRGWTPRPQGWNTPASKRDNWWEPGQREGLITGMADRYQNFGS